MDRSAEAIRRSRPGTFLDIGAHHGFYTLMAASRHRKVYAFEPHPDNFAKLNEAVRSKANICLVPMAISDRSGKVPLYICRNNSGGHSISKAVAGRKSWGHDGSTILVEATTVDEFVIENKIDDVTGMKVDVEGAEELVIRGARNTLTRFDPLIALETHLTADLDAVADLLAHAGYQPNRRDARLLPDIHYLFEKRPC